MSAYRADIDGLRAVAILSVVFFHVDPNLLPGGFTGVDIFFVISGYLITRIIVGELGNDSFTFFNFWMRRARRILPALLFMIGTVTIISFFLLMPSDLKSYGGLLFHSILFAANIYLTKEKGYFAAEDQNNPLLHVWSLSVEEQYYLVWPVLLVLAARKLPLRWRIAVFGILIGVSLGFSEWASHHDPKQAFFGLASRAFELLIGAAIAFCDGKVRFSDRAAQAMAVAGGLLLCAGFVLISEQTRFPGVAALLPCLGAALLIGSGTAASPTLAGSLLSSPILVGIGRISYSWYLWHWPPLALLRYYFDRPSAWFEICAALATGLILAVLSWRFIERPFRTTPVPARFKRRFVPVAAALSLALLTSGIAFEALKGVPQRLDATGLAMYEEFHSEREEGCNRTVRPTVNTQRCEFGTSAPAPSILLWGDSHARHYLPALARIAAAQGVTGLAHIASDCRPFIAPESIDRNSRRRHECIGSNEETLALLANQPDISLVVLAARWSVSEILSDDHSRIAIFKRNFEKTITALQKMGKKVVVLDQVPTIPFRIDECMIRKSFFNDKSMNCETYQASRINRYELSVLQAMKEVKASHGVAQTFSPYAHFCDGEVCRTVNEAGAPFYRDDDHLTNRGAYYLEPYIAQAIGSLRPDRGPQLTRASFP